LQEFQLVIRFRRNHFIHGVVSMHLRSSGLHSRNIQGLRSRTGQKRTMRLIIAIMLLLMAGQAQAACPSSGNCVISTGRYLAFPPAGWDGKTALPTMIFLHGYNQTPENYAEPSGWFMGFGREKGVLIILPEGKEKTWSYIGSPMENRDDAGFIGQVLDDVEARYPVDRKRLWIGGFSQGGSMAWYAGCALGDRIAAVTPVAGAFWEPLPKTCEKGPLNMLHIHGSADDVVPMAGRAIGDRWRQGDVKQSIKIMLTSGSCTADMGSETLSLGPMTDCKLNRAVCGAKSEKRMMLCMHEGGHWMTRDYLDAAWAFMGTLPN
jgi:polyhydroxybutyrate depolymerase